MDSALSTTRHGSHRNADSRHWLPSIATLVLCWLVLAGVIIGIGELLVGPLKNTALARWDERVPEWFAAHRTGTWNGVTWVGSRMGDTITVIAIVVIVGIVLLIKKRFEQVAFLVLALVVEVSIFFVTTLVISRPRPTVPKLDVSPPTSSYPSGHTAAATVLYISLAVITAYALARADQARRFTGWLVSVAALIILFVAVSRLYRGMHHPTDVVAGFLLGLGALLVTTMAVKAWRGDSS